jgi:hypothetical protein
VKFPAGACRMAVGPIQLRMQQVSGVVFPEGKAART